MGVKVGEMVIQAKFKEETSESSGPSTAQMISQSKEEIVEACREMIEEALKRDKNKF